MFVNVPGLLEDDFLNEPDTPYENDEPAGPSQVHPGDSQPSPICNNNVEDTTSADIEVCKQFYTTSCGCSNAQGKPCSSQFTVEHYVELRAQCGLLTHDELDLVLMGFTSSAMVDSNDIRDGRHQNPPKRKRLTMLYKHHGIDVCRKTFLFLYGIGKDRLQAVKDSYKKEGLQVRRHKNTQRSPHHAMPFAAKRNVATFLYNYAEENAILLPGQIPGYKRDDIKLLPSSCSKKVRYHCLVHTI